MDRRAFVGLVGTTLAGLGLAACTSASTQSSNSAGNTGASDTNKGVELKISALSGPTAMGLIKFKADAEVASLDENTYTFQLMSSPDEVTPALIQASVDIAAVPANLAAVLYNKTKGKMRVLCINTLGVLYICELGSSVKSIQDLKGKTIIAAGQGATPEYALRYVLQKSGLDPDTDVSLVWKSEHAEVVAALAQQHDALALLPEPFVSAASAKQSALHVALDINELWKTLVGSDFPQGVTVARQEVVDEHPEAIKAFLSHYKESVEWVKGNTAEAAKLIGAANIVPEAVAAKALPNCHIDYLDGDNMKSMLAAYLEILSTQDMKAVGGALPQDDFYTQITAS